MTQQVKHYEDKLSFEMDPADLHDNLEEEKNIIVIDTRSEEAFKREHIPGAINFPHRTMNEESAKKLDKDPIYVTYCDGIGCNASTKGALNLAKLGFNVRELIGGIEWWKKDGYATEGEENVEAKPQIGCSC